MKTKNLIYIVIISLAAGMLLGYWFFSGDKSENSAEHVHTDEIYTCSMHPQIRRNEPGKCPICGMDLVPVNSLETSTSSNSVTLSKTAAALANIQTTLVGSGSVEKSITLNGTIVPAETSVRSQTAHVDGRIESLYVNSTGESVTKGQRLALVYAPDLILAQKELIQVAARKDVNPGLYRASVSKLKSFELSDAQIAQIESSGKISENIVIHADYNGIVTKKLVNLGDHLKAGQVLLELTDLSRLWVNFEAYESDLPFIQIGDSVEFSVASLPGQTFSGQISFIDPVVNPNSRITDVRVVIENRKGTLKPDMFVRGKIKARSDMSSDELVLPKSAVLWTGERSLVYVETPGNANTYQLRTVVLGTDLGESYVITSGLKPGERVVTRGTFAVDAAAQLSGKESMMNPPANAVSPLPQSFNRKEFDPVLDSYLDLKNALVQSEFDQAKKFSEQLSKLLSAIPGVEEGPWNESLSQLRTSAQNMENSGNIDELRKHFILLSEEMTRWSRGLGESGNPLYIMYCPMANDNGGAVWISRDERIENPYYGDMMLNCGEIKETIN